jgi:hypothetical protein
MTTKSAREGPVTATEVNELSGHETKLLWPSVRSAIQAELSEFMATFVLVLLGEGSVAQVLLSSGTKGDWASIAWGWAYVPAFSSSQSKCRLT